MTGDHVYLLVGGSLLLAVVLPNALRRHPVSAPMILLVVGMLIGLLPLPGGHTAAPAANRQLAEHLTELCVIVALMGVGLALDRPLRWRSWGSWVAWGATWRLLLVAMPLCIAGVALLGWAVMGLSAGAAVLLGAALAPTDPVLASDVQVEGPSAGDEGDEEIDESDEVRFALTSEAGLNDGLAFPFVYAAILLASVGAVQEWGLHWLAWELVGKVVIGAAVGTAVGWALGKLAFRSPFPSLRLAEIGEPLLALAAVLLSYGLCEVAGGYGFIGVFACAMTIRSAERGHDYHAHMHESIDRLERLLTLVVLLLLGIALTDALLEDLTWAGAAVGVALVLVVRPVTAYVALVLGSGRDRVGSRTLTRPEQLTVAFFGVRGVGSIYYLAYATGEASFPGVDQLWATLGFTIALSVLVHGVAATPVLLRLDEAREPAEPSTAA